jgi:peptide/nickel transport system substrate-binding protein
VIARTVGAVAALVVIGGGLSAAAAAKPGESTANKVLRYGIQASNLGSGGLSNPAAVQTTDGPVLSIAYAPLIHDNPNGSFSPGLAVKWRFVGSQKVFELTLRRNARFSDGTPVTAAAVVTWLKYYAGWNNPFSGLLGPNPKFRAIGKWTARITMTVPNPTMPLMLSEENVNWGFVASPKAVANPDLFAKGTYGAGPYMLDYAQTVPGDHYTFVPNPYYYDKPAIKFKQVYVKAFADSASALQAQQAGQIDVQWNTDATVAPAAEAAGLQVVTAPFAISFIQLNPKVSKPLADARVRQAMNYALDRKAIASANGGKYSTGTSMFTITPDADPGLKNYYKYDPAKAKQLLAAAGYPNGFSLSIDVGNQPQANLTGLVAHYLDAIGIKTTVVTFPTRADYVKARGSFKDDAWIIVADVGVPTPLEYSAYIGTTSAFRTGEPVDPQVDRLYYAGLNSSNPKTSVKSWKKMWALITTQAWFLPISTLSDIFIASKGVGGVKMSPANPYAYPTEWFFK